jgi:hypothetical protein
VVQGAVAESTLLLDLPFGHIMYTGEWCLRVARWLCVATKRDVR